MTLLRTIKVMYVLCTLLLVGCSSWSLFDDFKVMDAQYADMEAVRTDTEFEYNPIIRGWIPEHLPVEAIDIYERHSLDTNEGWGKFSFKTIDLKALEKYWVLNSQVSAPGDPNRFADVEEFDWTMSGTSGKHTFSCGNFGMVIDLEMKQGYFWQVR